MDAAPGRTVGPARAWVRLPSGRRLDLISPTPFDWTDEDLAIGLARTYRWGGHSVWPGAPLSVAQHSLAVLALRQARARGGLTPAEQRRELLHDAEEGLLGFDCISPLKPFLGRASPRCPPGSPPPSRCAMPCRPGPPRRNACTRPATSRSPRPRRCMSRAGPGRRCGERSASAPGCWRRTRCCRGMAGKPGAPGRPTARPSASWRRSGRWRPDRAQAGSRLRRRMILRHRYLTDAEAANAARRQCGALARMRQAFGQLV